MGKLCRKQNAYNIDANPKSRDNTREQYDLCNPRIQLNPENFGTGYDSCNNWECMCKGHQPLSAFRSSSTPYQAPKATNVTAKMPVKTCMALINYSIVLLSWHAPKCGKALFERLCIIQTWSTKACRIYKWMLSHGAVKKWLASYAEWVRIHMCIHVHVHS